MRVADNRVISVLSQYREQLGGLYPEGEVKAIVRTVFQERLGWDVAQMEVRKFGSLSESDLLKVYLPLTRLRAGEPIQHVLGHVYFHGLRLRVTPDVLIPRPETEELVEHITSGGFVPTRIVDIGTGSGCIALALKQAFPGASVTGIDISERALEVAASNARLHALGVEFVRADVLDPSWCLPAGTDLVVSNPPYIPRSEEDTLPAHVRAREPYIALFTPDDDSLVFHRAIAAKAIDALPAGGHLWFEGHWKHAPSVGELLSLLGPTSVEVIKDLSGNDRFIHAVR